MKSSMRNNYAALQTLLHNIGLHMPNT